MATMPEGWFQQQAFPLGIGGCGGASPSYLPLWYSLYPPALPGKENRKEDVQSNKLLLLEEV